MYLSYLPTTKTTLNLFFSFSYSNRQVGVLISVEEDEGVVKLESGDLKMLMLNHLCRMPYEEGHNPNRRAASSMSGPEADDDED